MGDHEDTVRILEVELGQVEGPSGASPGRTGGPRPIPTRGCR
jgi:hypothetical protein